MAVFDAVLMQNNRDETSFGIVLNLSKDIDDNRRVLIDKAGGATIVLKGVIFNTSGGSEVALTVIEAGKDV